MEGLDLFVPTVTSDSSSSESSEEEEELEELCVEEEEMGGDGFTLEDWCDVSGRERRPRRAKAMARFYVDDGEVDIEGEEEELGGGRGSVRDFEIEKSQGLKMVLKKSSQFRDDSQQQPPQELMKVC
jgi:hypothetical protein